MSRRHWRVKPDIEKPNPYHRIDTLEALIRHMWVHDGYEKNGYKQMTSEQKKLYESIIKEERG